MVGLDQYLWPILVVNHKWNLVMIVSKMIDRICLIIEYINSDHHLVTNYLSFGLCPDKDSL